MGNENVRDGKGDGLKRGWMFGRELLRRRMCVAPVSDMKRGSAEADKEKPVDGGGSGAAGAEGKVGGGGGRSGAVGLRGDVAVDVEGR